VRASENIRREISQLEAEERALRSADKAYWSTPCHGPVADAEYHQRRTRLVSLRKQVADLYDELASAPAKP
jgi:hypothetical protein